MAGCVMKEQQPHSWRVPCGRREGGVWLHQEVVVTRGGVGARLAVHPATIVRARYDGAYEGASWLCFPVQVQELAGENWRNWDGDEVRCQGFWRGAQVQELLIGLGDGPAAAYDDLVDQACARVGVDRVALTRDPA